MIIKNHQINDILSDKSKLIAILVYGPNEGLVRENINLIKKKYEENEQCEIITFEEKTLDQDHALLETAINTISMFNEKKIIHVNSLKDKHLSFLENINPNSTPDVLLICKKGNLNKSSKLRKFFEANKSFYVLPCYEDDFRSITNLISDFEKKNTIKFNNDIKNYLLQNLSSDRMVSLNELEKIVLYCKKSTDQLKLENLEKILNDTSSNSFQIINETIMFGEKKKGSRILDKSLSEGVNAIALIRGLINYLKRLKKTKIELAKGHGFDDAIRTLSPPLFWKDKNNFREQCSKIPLNELERFLNSLHEAEVSCKTNSQLTNTICTRTLLSISQKTGKYFSV